MQAGLFCPRLSYFGGAEKFASLTAQVLREQGHRVELLSLDPVPARSLERRFGCRLDGVRIRKVRLDRDLIARTARYDLFVNNGSSFHIPAFARRNWLWVHDLPNTTPDYLDFYEIFANSEFTRRWIGWRWRKESGVLIGPVNIDGARPGRKEKMILTVGRLHALPVPKNELPLIHLFGGLHRAGSLAGWSFHVAGVLDPKDEAWRRGLCRAASGSPVIVHLNPDFRELRSLYERASIYWHGCGIGESERAHPERMEHFGAAVAEAMAAGCIAMVPDRGGPKDFVRGGRNGYQYRNWVDLGRKTVLAADRTDGLGGLRTAAMASASRYSLDEFRRQIRRRLRGA